jgi:hypothetical protein
MKRISLISLILLTLVAPAIARASTDGPVSDTQVVEERPDIATVIYTAAARLRGIDTPSENVTFAPAAQVSLEAGAFDADGFGRPRFTLMRYVEAEDADDRAEIGAVLVFSDGLTRRAHVSLLMDCVWSKDSAHITVETARVERVSSPAPEMMLAIVPAERVPADLLKRNTHAELLGWIIENRATDEELHSGGADDCYLFAVVYDRFAPGATLGIRISDSSYGGDGDAGNTRDIDYDGWHVAVMRGTFEWIGDPLFFVKVVSTSGADDTTPQVLGVLSSHLIQVDSLGRPVRSAPLAGLTDGTVRIVSFVLPGVGALVALFGFKLGRLVFAIIGLLLGGVAAFVAIDLFAMTHPVMMLVTLGLGLLIGSLLFAAIRWLALILLGGAIGGAIGVMLTGTPFDPASPVILVGAGVSALVALIARRWFTILLTAGLGAALVTIGAGQWMGELDIRTWSLGHVFPECLTWTRGQLFAWLRGPDGPDTVLRVLVIAVFVLGALIQFSTTRKKRAGSGDDGGNPRGDDDDGDDGGDD